jgi:hypothetical protein
MHHGILHGRPSILWVATESANKDIFRLCLEYVNKHNSPGDSFKPKAVIENVLSKENTEILNEIMEYPEIFPR